MAIDQIGASIGPSPAEDSTDAAVERLKADAERLSGLFIDALFSRVAPPAHASDKIRALLKRDMWIPFLMQADPDSSHMSPELLEEDFWFRVWGDYCDPTRDSGMDRDKGRYLCTLARTMYDPDTMQRFAVWPSNRELSERDTDTFPPVLRQEIDPLTGVVERAVYWDTLAKFVAEFSKYDAQVQASLDGSSN